MSKKIVIIDGHPNPDSLNTALAEAYMRGAKVSDAEVKIITVRDLQFNPSLQFGYQKRTELEPDLLEAFEKIKWADHLVWIHPVWWSSMPAILKGFIDRVFLPGFTYQPIENSIRWRKLLKGKTARIITTLDQPAWFYKIINGSPSVIQLKRGTLEFCGVKPVKVTYITPVKRSSDAQYKKWIAKIEKMGQKQK